MFLDYRFFPVRYNHVVVKEKHSFSQRIRYHTEETYQILTDMGKNDIPADVFYSLAPGDSIIFQTSKVSGALNGIVFGDGHTFYLEDVAYIRPGSPGFFWLILVSAGAVASLLFYGYIRYKSGRVNVSFAILIAVLVIFFFYDRPFSSLFS